MSSAMRSQASVRLVQSFSATSPKVLPAMGVRHLSITGPREASPNGSSFESTVASIPKRSDMYGISVGYDHRQLTEYRSPSGNHYNTSRTMKQVNDSSTVDFAFIPAISFTHTTNSEFSRIPLLPDNYTVRHPDTSPEPHFTSTKAEISTTSLSDAVATLSEAEISKAADAMGLHDVMGKDNVVKRVWNDLLDDVLGSKKSVHAA